MSGESNQWLRSVLENSSEIVTLVDTDGTLRYASPAWKRVLGYDPVAMVGKNVLDFVHPEDLPHVLEETEKALAAGGIVSNKAEYRFRHKDGSWRWLESVGTYLLEDPAVGGVVVNSRDVSERKKAEEALQHSEAEIFGVMERINDGFFALDREWRCTYVNSQAASLLGKTKEDLVGERLWKDATFFPQYQRAVADGKTARFEAYYPPMKKWYSVRAYPSESGLSVYFQDVTERKEAEERLRAQYKNFPLPTFTWRRVNGDFVLVDHNDAAHEHTRGLAGELLGLKSTEFFDDWPGYAEMIERCFRDRSTSRWKVPWRTLSTGEYKRFVVTCVFVPPDMVMVHTEDITERINAEERIRFQAQLLDQVGEAVIAVDENVRVLYWNRAAEDLYGWSAEEAMGRNLREMVVSEDLVGRAAEIMAEVREGKTWKGEFEVLRRDGTPFPVEATNTPVFGEDGDFVGVIAVLRDITERKQAEGRLRETEERYRTLVERVPAITYIHHKEPGKSSATIYVSPQVEAVLGYTPEEYTAEPEFWKRILHPDDRVRILAEDERTGRTGEEFDVEYRMISKDGSVVWLRESGTLVRKESNQPQIWHGVMFEITELKRVQEELMEARERYRNLVERIPAIVYVDQAGRPSRTTYISPQNETILGYSSEEVLKDPELWLKIMHPDDRERVLIENRRADETGEPFRTEYRQFAKDGSVVWLRDEAALVRDEKGEPLYWLGVQTDVTERKALEEELQHRALHDLLTDLPNRQLFVDRLGQALMRTRRSGRKVAILFADLDNFKAVNDSLGHEVGDRLLVAVAGRLKLCLRPEDTLARFGGDEFVVLVEDVDRPGEAVRVAERITMELQRPFELDGREIYAPASIGISLGDAGTKSPEDLLRDADTAMYRAKDEGVDFRVFDPAMYARALGRLELESDLRRAVEAGEFVVRYQPIFALDSGEVWGIEALLRWNHPERGLLEPSEFVTVAEETGLIVPIGNWVLEEACRRTRELQEGYPRSAPLRMIVNLSAKQLRQPDCVEIIQAALARSGLEPQWLSLDVTETDFIDVLEGHTLTLERIQALGVRVSVDDFGIGYSSLSYLKRLPANALKIDKSFVRGFGEDTGDTAIVRMVIEMAHILGLEVVAEGVETWTQAALLGETGCDLAQGFYFAGPMQAEEIPPLLSSDSSSW